MRLDPSDIALIARAVVDAAPPDRALINADVAAKLLGVPASWVLAEARADRLPHIRLGRYVRFDADKVLAWAAARSRGPRATAQRSQRDGVAGRVNE